MANSFEPFMTGGKPNNNRIIEPYDPNMDYYAEYKKCLNGLY
jgi:hypothetical protein